MNEIRKEIIKLTDENLYPKLIGLLENKGEKVGSMSRKWDNGCDLMLFDKNVMVWSQAFSTEDGWQPNITDIEFLAKYERKQLKGLSEKTAIHCPEESDAIAVCKLFHEAGWKWKDGRDFLDSHDWNYRKEITCYDPSGQVAGIHYYKERNFTILPAKQFLALNSEQEAESQKLKETEYDAFIKWLDQNNLELDMKYYPNQNNRWIAHVHRGETKEGCCLTGEYGIGGNAKHATYHYIERIKGKKLVVNACTENRREIDVPKVFGFSLQCQDGVIVNDPEQIVWYISSENLICWVEAKTAVAWDISIVFSLEQAVKSHLKKTAQIFKLEDMTYKDGVYSIPDFIANQILKERLK